MANQTMMQWLPFHKWLAPVSLLLMLWSGLAAAQNILTASVDRTEVGQEETLQLSVRYNGQVMFDEPDFSDLQKNFDILGRHRSNQYRSVNGRTESWTRWMLTLAPKRTGKLLIPSFEYDGSFSDAIEITVRKNAPAPTPASEQPVYLETELDKQQLHVQEQLLYTLRLFTSVDLSGVDRGDFTLKNTLMKQVAENQYQRVINGQAYGVLEITYAIFPQQSGTLTLPSQQWTVTVDGRQSSYDPFASRRGKRLRVSSQARDIEVLPKPDSYTGDHWLPAGDIRLQQSWSGDTDQLVVGEPVTRNLIVEAQGLTAAQLPPLNLTPVDGLKYYPDQPRTSETESADGIDTTRTESYAIVASRAGRFTLPPVELQWWDSKAATMRTARLPEQVIEVKSGTGTVLPPTTQGTDTRTDKSGQKPALDQPDGNNATAGDPVAGRNNLWPAVALLLAAGNLLFALLWWRARTKATVATPAPRAARREDRRYRALLQALQGRNEAHLRECLLDWGREHYRAEDMTSLSQLAERAPELRTAIDQLQASLYGQHSDLTADTGVDTAELRRLIKQLQRQTTPTRRQRREALRPLYRPGS